MPPLLTVPALLLPLLLLLSLSPAVPAGEAPPRPAASAVVSPLLAASSSRGTPSPHVGAAPPRERGSSSARSSSGAQVSPGERARSRERSSRPGAFDGEAPPGHVPGPGWLPPTEFPLNLLGGYRPPEHEYAAGHRGIDLDARTGLTVASPVTGTVAFSGIVAGRGVVSIRVDEHVVYSLEPVVGAPVEGSAILVGDAVGVVGEGGHCVANCLHLGVRVDGEYRDPMLLFAGRARLLPL